MGAYVAVAVKRGSPIPSLSEALESELPHTKLVLPGRRYFSIPGIEDGSQYEVVCFEEASGQRVNLAKLLTAN